MTRPLSAIAALAGVLACAAVNSGTIPMEGFVLARDGTRLHYEIAGSGPKTVVVSGGFMLRGALDPLTTRWRVVFYDARGRGRSDASSPQSVSLQHQVDDLDDLITALKLGPVVLLGYSGMGKELFAYAMQHPERIERFLQVAPVPPYAGDFIEPMMATRYARADPDALSELRSRREAGVWADDPAGYCRAEAAVTNVMTFADPANVAAFPDVCIWPNEWPTTLVGYYDALLPSVEAYDARDDLPADALPRLVIYGEQDAIPVQGRRAWVDGAANACLIEIPGAAHWPMVEAAKPFFAAAHAFIGGSWPGGCSQPGADSAATSETPDSAPGKS